MRIRRIRIVLPARLAPEALATARLTGREIVAALEKGGVPAGPLSTRLAGAGRPAPMLARAAAAALVRGGRR